MQVWQESPARSGFVLQVRACFPLCFLPTAAAAPGSLLRAAAMAPWIFFGGCFLPARFLPVVRSAGPAKSLCLGNAGAAPVSPEPTSSAASS